MGLAPGEWNLTAEIEAMLPSGTSCMGYKGDKLVCIQVCGIEERKAVIDNDAAPDTGDVRLDKIITLLNRLDGVSLPNMPENVRLYNKVRPQYD